MDEQVTGKRFQKGQSGNPAGRRPKIRKPKSYGEPRGDKALSPLERAMLLVMSQPETDDETLWEIKARAWLEKDERGFLTKLADIQKSGVSKPGNGPNPSIDGLQSAAPVEDVGAQACIALCEKLLRKFAEEDGLYEKAVRELAAEDAAKKSGG
jgi:Family of unknown function (DUF5681)